MPMTISFQNGSNYCFKHNSRDAQFCAKEPHIDLSKPHEIWHQEKLGEAYKNLFGEAVKTYNEKQKRTDRKIKNYLSMIQQDKTRHECYECIVQIGSKNNPCDEQVGKQILRKFYDDWQVRNPSLHVVGCYYHADEQGAPHLHIDYVPVAKGYKNGMAVQNGLEKALSNINPDLFRTQKINGKQLTGQMIWQQRERDCLTDMCNERGLGVVQGVAKGKQHQDTEIFKREKQLEKNEQAVADREADLQKREKKEMDIINARKQLEKNFFDATQVAPSFPTFQQFEEHEHPDKNMIQTMFDYLGIQYKKLYQLASGAVHALHKWRNMSADDLEERAQAYRDVGAKNGFEYNDIVIKKEEQERAQEAEKKRDSGWSR